MAKLSCLLVDTSPLHTHTYTHTQTLPPASGFSTLFYSVTLYSLNWTLTMKNQPRMWIRLSGNSYKVPLALVEAAGCWQFGMPWVMWSFDLYLGSVTLPSNNWLMVYGNSESRSHPSPWVGRLPHYLGPFTAALRKFYSQIRLNKVFSKKIIFGVWSSGSRRLDGRLLHWKGVLEASGDYRTETPLRRPSSVLQDWVFRGSHVTKTITKATSWPQIFWGAGVGWGSISDFCAGIEVLTAFIS